MQGYRDIKGWQEWGLKLTTQSNSACQLLECVVLGVYSWLGPPHAIDIDDIVTKMLTVDENFVMGHVTVAVFTLLESSGNGEFRPGTSKNLNQDIKNSIKIANQGCAKCEWWEKQHVEAMNKWAKGDQIGATKIWEKILVEHPRDPIALKAAHDTYFYLGQGVQMRDSIARVLKHYEGDNQYYGFILGMYSFGLEECGDYGKAFEMASKALEMNKNDAWATHTRAHIYEMQGKWEQGIQFLESTEGNWNKSDYLACHNYWHLGLYYIESNQLEGALEIYDKKIGSRWCKTGSVLDGIDAASFLQRLQIQGAELGNRWQSVSDQWQKHREDHILCYNDTHIMFAACGSGDPKTIQLTKNSIQNYSRKGNDLQAKLTVNVGLNLTDGVVAYWDGKYDEAVELMEAVRYDVRPIGGSNAQRDVFSQLLIKSAIESKNYKNLAAALINERRALKPQQSPLTERFQSRLDNL
eukprot:TRINITY_DN3274_c2_g1_i11.p1 TRINITY_DN3274_c2_g1~~TRINITY_DN3274_c2_g1_i11.p1  ORF type:complete len:467 (-),score=70.84 TRINITY_DN3274_c2_g1_i11:384-1784(-)